MARRRRRRDFVVFEYLENGDLAQLINKLVEAQLTATTNAARDETRVPNRVLWAFVSNFQSYPYPYLTLFGKTFLNLEEYSLLDMNWHSQIITRLSRRENN